MQVACYSCKSGQWSSVCPLPAGHGEPGIAVLDNRIDPSRACLVLPARTKQLLGAGPSCLRLWVWEQRVGWLGFLGRVLVAQASGLAPSRGGQTVSG